MGIPNHKHTEDHLGDRVSDTPVHSDKHGHLRQDRKTKGSAPSPRC